MSYFLTGQSYQKGKEPARYTAYSGQGNPEFIKGTYERYRQKDISANVLNIYGWGDGGGPTHWDIENINRMQNGMTDFPVARHGKVAEFFKELHEKTDENENVPVWSDELYFELHRGVYTTVGEVKKNNRKAEYALQNLEFVRTLDETLCGEEYPFEEIEELWEILLKNQFHDILPGSSVKEVYETTAKEHKQLLAESKELTKKAFDRLAKKSGAKAGYFLLNPNSLAGEYCVKVDGERRIFKNVPSKGYCVATPEPLKGTVKVGERSLENEFFSIVFDEQYNIIGIYDKRNDRQVLKSGCKGNILRLYDDYNKQYDAWEISDFYTEKCVDLTETLACTPVVEGCRSGLRIRKKFGRSTLVQTIFLYEDIDRIDFKTEVDWHEKHKLLKALFPLDINAKKATYDIQFGTTERPTTSSTTWEQAKFEVFAHKYADISEGDYGVALLNDCKYGYSAMENVLGISLLRTPTWPDEDTDMGMHEFTYSLYPHAGNHAQSGVYRHAIMLNNPPLVKKLGEGDIKPVSYSWLTCDKDNVIVESLKKSEDSLGWVVRCFERNNTRTKANLRFALSVKEIFECDMMENVESSVSVHENQASLTFRPFEIKTLKIILA